MPGHTPDCAASHASQRFDGQPRSEDGVSVYWCPWCGDLPALLIAEFRRIAQARGLHFGSKICAACHERERLRLEADVVEDRARRAMGEGGEVAAGSDR